MKLIGPAPRNSPSTNHHPQCHKPPALYDYRITNDQRGGAVARACETQLGGDGVSMPNDSGLVEPLHVISLGAGVQSSTMALMAAHGEITPMPTAAIFADTQAEPKSVYDWLEWLEKQLPFPVHRVTAGDLTADSLRVRKIVKPDAKLPLGTPYLKKLIPVFGRSPEGEKVAAIGRRCTVDYKIVPVIRKVKEFLREKGIKPRGTEKLVTQWIGISWDEVHRMKPPRDAWIDHRWPLVEMRTSRQACLDWMRKNQYPEPPRSSCVYCPFHSDSEWQRIKDSDPDGWSRVVEFDKVLRQRFRDEDKSLHMEVYLHDSLKPITEVDFSARPLDQPEFDFASECEGMCGV